MSRSLIDLLEQAEKDNLATVQGMGDKLGVDMMELAMVISRAIVGATSVNQLAIDVSHIFHCGTRLGYYYRVREEGEMLGVDMASDGSQKGDSL